MVDIVNTIDEMIKLLEQIDQDAGVLAAIANDSELSVEHGPGQGLVTTRLGATVKNMRKVIADVENGITREIRPSVQDEFITVVESAKVFNFVGPTITVEEVDGVAQVTVDAPAFKKNGIPSYNQVAVWDDDSTLRGSAHLTFNGNDLILSSSSDPAITITDLTNAVNLETIINNPGVAVATFGTTTNHSLRFQTNDIDRVTITNNGFVGIGTNTPTQDLVVQGNDPVFRLEDNDTGNKGNVSINDTNLIISVDLDDVVSASTILFGIDGNGIARFTSDEKFGFGTTSPDLTLHVEGSGASAANDPSWDSRHVAVFDNGINTGIAILSEELSEINFSDGANALQGVIRYNHTTDRMTFDVNGDTMMRIYNNGNTGFGLGMDSYGPSAPLHVLDLGTGETKISATYDEKIVAVFEGYEHTSIALMAQDQSAVLFGTTGAPSAAEIRYSHVAERFLFNIGDATVAAMYPEQTMAIGNAFEPMAELHVRKTENTSTIPASYDASVVGIFEAGDYSGIGITSNILSTINFGDADDYDVGYIRYNHANDRLTFKVNGDTRMSLNEYGYLGVSSTGINPLVPLHIRPSGITMPGTLDGTVVASFEQQTTASIAIKGNTASVIDFADSSEQRAGRIVYDHGADMLSLSMGNGTYSAVMDYTTATDLPSDDSILTRARADARYAMSGGGGFTDLSSFTTDDLSEGTTNLYYDESAADARYIRKTGGTGGGVMSGYLHMQRASAANDQMVRFNDESGNLVNYLVTTQTNQFAMQGPEASAGNRVRILLNPDGEIQLRQATATATYYEAWMDFTTTTDLPSVASIVTRARGDNRYTLTSAARFKESIADADSAELVAIFDLLEPKEFVWGGDIPTEDVRHGQEAIGFIADDMPDERLKTYRWEADEEGKDTTTREIQGIDPYAMMAVMAAKIKELEARIQALESE